MRTQINLGPGRTSAEGGAEPAEPSEQSGAEFGWVGVQSDLIARWGLEHFAVAFPPGHLEVAALATHTRELVSDPSLKQVVTTSDHAPRDFWSEVAALSSASVIVPPNGLGSKPDLVAYAIATVAARYAMAAESKPGTASAALGMGATTQRNAPSTPTSSSSSAASERYPALEGCDVALVLESLLDFEQAAVLQEVRQLYDVTFDHVRGRAAKAVVAANVIADAALKAAEGRRG